MRIFKVMLGESSYFIEKYFHMDSLFWTILFMAACAAAVAVVLSGCVGHFWKMKEGPPAVGIGTCALLAVPFGQMMGVPFTWDSKLQRVMSNFLYVLSFPSNRKVFLDGAGLEDSEYNQNRLFRIAMSLKDSEWDAVTDAAEGAGWYFEKVHKAIRDIDRLGSLRFSEGTVSQGFLALLPVLIMAACGIFLLIKKVNFCGAAVLLCAVAGLVFNFGTSLFVLEAVCIYLLLRKGFQLTRMQIAKRRHSPTTDTEGGEGG